MIVRRRLLVSVCAAFLAILPVATHAEDWPEFRGPRGNGFTADKNVPTEWSAMKNVRWQTPLEGKGNGSPIVSSGRVFLTTALDDGAKRTLHCFDRRDGKQLWERTVEWKADEPTHNTNPYAATTPAADGKRVVVWHGSAGLCCYDFEGEELWKQDLGEFIHIWGYGTSPVLHEGKVLLNTGPGKDRSFVAAFALDDGKQLWRSDESLDETAQRRGYHGSWSTPNVVKIDGQDRVLCSMPGQVKCYDIDTGDVLWHCGGLNPLVYTSIIPGDGFGVAMGGYKGPAIGFRYGGEGDVTETNRLWRVETGNPQRIGTGVLVGDFIYMANDGPGVIQCIEARTGREVWRERLPGGNAWASIVATGDGLLYATSQGVSTTVFRPDPEKFDVVATNRLPGRTNATPAVSDSEIFLRTDDALYCIAAARE
ncbi:MAG: PQQ-binding-like beta-propeller repeat protein [Planctomycetaceae bacterium]